MDGSGDSLTMLGVLHVQCRGSMTDVRAYALQNQGEPRPHLN